MPPLTYFLISLIDCNCMVVIVCFSYDLFKAFTWITFRCDMQARCWQNESKNFAAVILTGQVSRLVGRRSEYIFNLILLEDHQKRNTRNPLYLLTRLIWRMKFFRQSFSFHKKQHQYYLCLKELRGWTYHIQCLHIAYLGLIQVFRVCVSPM